MKWGLFPDFFRYGQQTYGHHRCVAILSSAVVLFGLPNGQLINLISTLYKARGKKGGTLQAA
jgi:hypothetical protein